MGLGKTVEVVAYMVNTLKELKKGEKFLVVVPTPRILINGLGRLNCMLAIL